MIRKILINSFLVLTIFSSFYIVGTKIYNLYSYQALSNNSSKASLYKTSSKVAASVPVFLNIPALGINTYIEPVGQDIDGNMGVPKNVNNVAWYKYGISPGNKGNSVIAGHYDSLTGEAIFYKLESLKVGDNVFVTDSNGKVFNFVVKKISSYKDSNFPVKEVFSENSKNINLNLITCNGIFNRNLKEYNKRLVVSTTLEQ